MTSGRPRLCVFRSHSHIYCQVIDDQLGQTLASASTLDKEVRASVTKRGNKEAAGVVGKAIAQRALAAASAVCLIEGVTGIRTRGGWPTPRESGLNSKGLHKPGAIQW
jgi:ribosomal protein L18